MSPLTIYSKDENLPTIIPNFFIDDYMKDANDAQLKVYLHLLRARGGSRSLDLAELSRRTKYSERDILRALNYWEEKRLLSLDFDSSRNLTGICLNGAPAM